MLRILGVVFAILVAVVFAGIAWLDGGVMDYPMPGALVAERSAGRLTGAACSGLRSDTAAYRKCISVSAPIAAYAPYRRCGGYIESERVGASRIACSKAELLDSFSFLQFGEGRTAYREFRRACRIHDFCYVHSMATYDPKSGDSGAQKQCDRMLLADAVRDCRLQFAADSANLRKCRWAAMAAYTGVRAKGHEHFAKWNQAACDYEAGAHAPRDHVVRGKFVTGAPDGVVTIIEDADAQSITVEYLTLDDAGGSVRRAAIEALAPAGVTIADGQQACAYAPWNEAGRTCPVTLADAGFKSGDWLRFAPIVVDSDGDGADEIVLVGLVPQIGLALTHLKLAVSGESVTFEPATAFIAFNDKKEFWSATRDALPPLTDDRPIQMLTHEFVTVQRTPEELCSPTPEHGPQDIVLLGGRAEAGYQAIAHRMYRLTFDAAARRWLFIRDRFNDDRHKLRHCDRERVGSINLGTRLQYPALTVLGPVKCGGKTIAAETLSTIVREKCPTSTVVARAGELNDIDLLNYRINPKFVGGDDASDSASELNGARVSWLPIIWNEAADPVMTSRDARQLGVMLVSSYTGGTTKNRYPLITVLRSDLRLEQATKEDWRERQPDTLGVTPVQYALFASDPKVPVQSWNSQTFGDPAMFSHIPNVLAPFWTDGSPGLSLVMFANRASLERDNVARQTDGSGSNSDGTGILKRGTVQVLITPIADKVRPVTDPRWLECPVPAGEELAEAPARPLLRWRSDFLYQEPVLPGRYFAGDKGGLAIAYRTTQGRLAVTTLQNRPSETEGDVWWLGRNQCRALSAKKPDGSPAERRVWMMRLN